MFIKKLLPQDPAVALDQVMSSNALNSPQIRTALQKIGVSNDNTADFIHGIFGGRQFPSQLAGNNNLQDKIIAKLQGAKESTPVTKEQAKEALQLIQSGELFRDVAFTISALFSFIAKPEQFSHPATQVLSWLMDLAPAIVADIGPEHLKALVSDWVADVRAGQQPTDPQILNNTLKQVYSLQAVGNAIDTANVLFSKDNESLRLALVIYLRLRGVNVSENDIDEVRATVLNRSEPELGGLLKYIFSNQRRLLGIPD